jgi:hypothetical protein
VVYCVGKGNSNANITAVVIFWRYIIGKAGLNKQVGNNPT